MIRALEIVMVNLGFITEAASQIINFKKMIAKFKKIIKELSWFFCSSFSQVGFTCFLHGLTNFILVSGDVHWSQWG